ncbi:hypothetical protein B0H14DRAFT_3510574 [Mycena olivaceomarginata]|nr:hypothetical protein B0H14DRAFT_3510574 [Mycena olivaceomarginata]
MDPAAAPSSSSSSRAPPFSLVEFRNLVSAALDSPDPIPFSESSPLFSVSYPPLESEQNGSRVRQIIQKFKKRATSLVRRSSTRTTAVVRANSPEYRIPELRLSANVSCDEFAPYLPLVAQYERRSPYVRPMSTCRSTPFLPSQYSLTNMYDLSNSSHTSFTPSPTRTSCSSGSTSSESQYPTTPLNTVFEANRRWSRCSTDETYENPSDPFAKPIVPVSRFHTYTPAITKPTSPPAPPPRAPSPFSHQAPARIPHPRLAAAPAPLPPRHATHVPRVAHPALAVAVGLGLALVLAQGQQQLPARRVPRAADAHSHAARDAHAPAALPRELAVSVHPYAQPRRGRGTGWTCRRPRARWSTTRALRRGTATSTCSTARVRG